MGGGLSFNGDLLVQEISRAVSTFAQVEWLFLYSLAVWMRKGILSTIHMVQARFFVLTTRRFGPSVVTKQICLSVDLYCNN